MTNDSGGLACRLLWFAPPPLLVIGTALYLASAWNRIPQTFPIHSRPTEH